jgi:hypothetical protein
VKMAVVKSPVSYAYRKFSHPISFFDIINSPTFHPLNLTNRDNPC